MRLMHTQNFFETTRRTDNNLWVAYVTRLKDSGDGHFDKSGIVTDIAIADAWTRPNHDLTNLQAMQIASTAVAGAGVRISYAPEHIGEELVAQNRTEYLQDRSNFNPHGALVVIGAPRTAIDKALRELVANSNRPEAGLTATLSD